MKFPVSRPKDTSIATTPAEAGPHYQPLLAQVIQYAHPGAILDIGAGSGLFVEAAHRWGLQCVGLEGSEDGVAAASQRCPKLDLRLHRLSTPMPFANGRFAACVLNQVIEHLDRDLGRAVLREAHRVLRPGGLLLVTSPSRFNRTEIRADPTHAYAYTPADLADVVTAAGFTGIVPMDAPRLLPSAGGLGLVYTAAFRLSGWER